MLIDEIGNNRADVFLPEALANAGAIVSIGYNGRCEVARGYVLPVDQPKPTARKAVVSAESDGTAAAGGDDQALPKALLENLVLHKSAALTAELMQKPEIALAYLVHALVIDLFPQGARSCISIDANPEHFDDLQGSPVWSAIEGAREQWRRAIPLDPAELLDWCLAQERSVLLDLLAFSVALCVDVKRGDHHHLERSLKLDMSKWFTPTAENYFGRITKAAILQALAAVRGSVAPAWNALKKAELAAIAERELAVNGWLPEVLKSQAEEIVP